MRLQACAVMNIKRLSYYRANIHVGKHPLLQSSIGCGDTIVFPRVCSPLHCVPFSVAGCSLADTSKGCTFMSMMRLRPLMVRAWMNWHALGMNLSSASAHLVYVPPLSNPADGRTCEWKPARRSLLTSQNMSLSAVSMASMNSHCACCAACMP